MKIESGGKTWSLEGVPRHMIESMPHTCMVVVSQVGLPEREHVVQLERDGRLLTLADVRPGWCRRSTGIEGFTGPVSRCTPPTPTLTKPGMIRLQTREQA